MTNKDKGKSEVRDLLKERIETKRLLLEPISMKYKEEIFREFTASVTTFMYPRPAKYISETEKFISDSLDGLKRGDSFQMVIIDKQSREFLGCAGLYNIDTKMPEMGIWLKVKSQGNRYGGEAMTALKDWAIKNISFDYIKYPVESGSATCREGV